MKYTWKTEGNVIILLINDRAIAHIKCPGFYTDYDGYCYSCPIIDKSIRDDLKARNLEEAQAELINIVIRLYKDEIEGMEASIWTHQQVITLPI